MDISEALEDMVATAPDIYDQTFQPSDDSIKRRQTLFNYTPLEAAEYIKDRKLIGSHLNLTSLPMGDDPIRKRSPRPRPRLLRILDRNLLTAIYLVRLTPLLPTASKIQEIAHLPDLPATHAGTSDTDSPALFCRIDGPTLHALRTWLLNYDPSHHNLTTVRLTLVAKDLSPDSIYPTLGHDATLPHHRPPTPSLIAGQVMQHDYPVLYFFYGFLADPERLTYPLSRPTITSHNPNLVPAT
ncbi:MAG: hypothetical protein Q9203_007356, partial [Teloschistes exilis]